MNEQKRWSGLTLLGNREWREKHRQEREAAPMHYPEECKHTAKRCIEWVWSDLSKVRAVAVICSIVRIYYKLALGVAFYRILVSTLIDLNNMVHSGFFPFSSVQSSRNVQFEMHNITKTVYPQQLASSSHQNQTRSKPAGINASSLVTTSRQQLSASPNRFRGTRHKSHPEARISGL